MLDAQFLALDLIRALRPLCEQVARQGADLADQLRRAATSAALNTAEGNRRDGRDRAARFRIAAGECAEAATAVQVAVDWGYVPAAAVAWGWLDDAAVTAARALADRVARVTYALAR